MTFDERGDLIDRLGQWGTATLYAVRLQTCFAVVLMIATNPWVGVLALLCNVPAFMFESALRRVAGYHLRKMREEVERLRERAKEVERLRERAKEVERLRERAKEDTCE